MTDARLTRRQGLSLAASLAGLGMSGCATVGSGRGSYEIGPLIHQDDFRSGLSRWRVELERGGRVSAQDASLVIDTPAGATVWFRPELMGPVMIEYQAVAVASGGINDQVSDLNAFWMATDIHAPAGRPPRDRSGAFADYDDLLTYYVGQGGNRNTTTRMRRYVGERSNRPLQPEHDLADPREMLQPNRVQTVRLVAAGHLVEYWRDNRRLFHLHDPAPYERGWFGFRTTYSHLRFSNLRIHALRLTGPS